MAKNPTPSASVPAADATPTRIRALLQRLAESKARARTAGVPWRFNSGMNKIPNRFHLDHIDGDAVAALKEIAENVDALLAEVP